MKIHQNYMALFTAAGFAFLVLIANMVTQAPDGMMRMGYAVALYLISRDTLAGASIAKGPRRFSNPDRWVFAFYMALFFGTFMLLLLWRGIGGLGSQLIATVLGALIYGIAMAFLPSKGSHPYAHHFQTENPSSIRRFFYYAAPLLKLAIIWILVQNSPPSAAYLFFFIALIGFAFPHYRRKTNGNPLWANFPTLVGYLLLTLIMATHL